MRTSLPTKFPASDPGHNTLIVLTLSGKFVFAGIKRLSHIAADVTFSAVLPQPIADSAEPSSTTHTSKGEFLVSARPLRASMGAADKSFLYASLSASWGCIADNEALLPVVPGSRLALTGWLRRAARKPSSIVKAATLNNCLKLGSDILPSLHISLPV